MKIAVEMNDALYANFDAEAIWPGVEFTASDFHHLPSCPADKIIFITTDAVEIAKIENLFDDTLYWEISENDGVAKWLEENVLCN